jgi:hypothetical protein
VGSVHDKKWERPEWMDTDDFQGSQCWTAYMKRQKEDVA